MGDAFSKAFIVVASDDDIINIDEKIYDCSLIFIDQEKGVRDGIDEMHGEEMLF